MRLARFNLACDQPNSAVNALAATGELDLLQLDCQGSASPRSSAAFFQHLRTLHKHFYLDPQLRLITNAGSGNVWSCVETLGQYLREHDDAGMPITAVRGENLLPWLSELTSEGVEFVDETTGDSLLAVEQPLHAAQVELGAGPLATAWEEGSRMIVAGCYDPVAPFVGAVKAELNLAWDDYDTLAGAAVAAQAAWLTPAIVEILAPGKVTMEPADQRTLDPVILLQRLRELATSDALLPQTDVVSDLSSTTLNLVEFGRLRLTGSRGQEPSGSWRVRFTFADEGVVDVPEPQETADHDSASALPRIVEHWAHVPRDAVNVSVDTRPAAEWL